MSKGSCCSLESPFGWKVYWFLLTRDSGQSAMWIFFKIYLRGKEEEKITYGRQTLHHWGFMFEKGEKRKRQNTAKLCKMQPLSTWFLNSPKAHLRELWSVVPCSSLHRVTLSPDIPSPHHLLPTGTSVQSSCGCVVQTVSCVFLWYFILKLQG